MLGLLPETSDTIRRSLYEGAIYLLPPSPATRRLAEESYERVRREFEDVGDPRRAQFELPGDEFFHRVGRLRRDLYADPRHQDAVREILREHGLEPGQVAFDPIRIRAIAHRGFEDPKAAPVYFPHRDTWYANPQAQTTWWIPLHDVAAEETFVFFPDLFRTPVDNNSEEFDYGRWTAGGPELRIGWQRPDAGLMELYPGQIGAAQDGALGFSARAGQLLVFAGAHLHRTLANTTGRTRFSIDFRVVHLDDLDRGAPNVDNRSTGTAVADWIHPILKLDEDRQY